ncbi:telokinin-like peptide [Spodoptera frugiperda multiple nucleopolyhedrovirus]|uniref:Telokinin-like peptide n=1 Tax=Spodoptera frugiperda nuclear polyhedrosis virus TaxID=10455 RepID=A1YJ70_NPVSF|nr:telokinin-like peptide [Spodoptera frugiperda multiple nucleopolyhedrovirus]ABM45790.1 telokinin-like peptide [Spodoptera frugiperda multiple nucleopolyhedrovirus]ACA02637.1 unknown [Spodoptera frugiperda multiple nucleopolyhedrovirus]ADV91313.1 tlp20 [Spodoptera frugiperda multiple nucleopolyhedrovirus]AFH59024.1 tlp20 [Spodoptera frugiperda multiple nucleopolyhedrovirus]AIW01490.1 telokinin-like peptide 20 [Spodoptera frugiperda multiple nucleopolyhedrovirus]
MATSNSGTIDISVHVTLDKESSKRNVLSFIVREEYHLKKLAVGAYNINILDTQLLNNLSQYKCNTVACGDYVIVYNFTENTSNRINVILFNIKPTILKKGNCIFKIVYEDDATAIVTTDKMLDEPVKQHHQEHANSQLFKSAFTRDSDDAASSSSSASSDESDEDGNVASRTAANDLSEAVPAKRQKLDNFVESQV